MVEGIIGRKLGMTQVFRSDGTVVPVTVLEAGPCTITQLRTRECDGYEAVQLGFGRARRMNKPERGHLKGLALHPVLREVPAGSLEGLAVGQRVDASIFNVGERVDVTGVSKGKGFAGVVKRHHFRGGPKTHGQSDRWRAPGSVGAGTTPGRVYKGTRMAGHMGHERVTVRNLEVLQVDADDNLLVVEGSVPGPKGGYVMIRRAKKVSKR